MLTIQAYSISQPTANNFYLPYFPPLGGLVREEAKSSISQML
ncbi:MAG: hypothetical protein N2235_17450 [Fischerella sp.]|nr:hypothetical protein [Fischerella sp.]